MLCASESHSDLSVMTMAPQWYSDTADSVCV